jgi:hypothetical protein
VKDYRILASTSEEDKVANLTEDGPIDTRICDDSPKYYETVN